MALNPNYKPLGFTIDSLASCSEGVLNDALKATQEAMTTILSTIGKYSSQKVSASISIDYWYQLPVKNRLFGK